MDTQFSQQAGQFLDMMKQFFNPNISAAMMKSFPLTDLSSFTSTMKNNAELFTKVNQIVAENAQHMVTRGIEMIQQGASEAVEVAKNSMSTDDMEQAASRQQQYISSTVKNSIDNSKEMMDIVAKSTTDIFQLLSNGVSETVAQTVAQASDKM